MTVPATVVIVTHNSAQHLDDCLTAVLSDDAPPERVIVVDNASTDSSTVIAHRHDVDVIELDTNVGLGPAVHHAVRRADTEILAFLNPDTLPRPGWLPPLVAALAEPGVGAAMATLELADRPGHFNSSGGAISVVGIAWATDVGEPIPSGDDPVDVAFPSGAAWATTAHWWEATGGFRPEFFMYHEDTDLGWRLRGMGRRVVRVPASRVLHHYEFSRNPDKMFHLERNRWLMVAANYRRSTRRLLMPVLVLAEVGVLVVAARDGWFRAKLGAMRSAWRLRRANQAAYAEFQQLRTLGDARLLGDMQPGFTGASQVAHPPGSRLLGKIVAGWRRLVLPVVRRGDRRRGLA